MFWLTPALCIILTLGAYQLLNPVLNVSTILIGLYLFDKLQQPIRSLPLIYAEILETLVSLRRVEVFKTTII